MTPKDKRVGVPMSLPIIGSGEQKVNIDEIIQKLMQNIHQLNQEYQGFVGALSDLNTKVTVLESRLINVLEIISAAETKQTAFPAKVEVVIKKEK